jgi:hypothetical protein
MAINKTTTETKNKIKANSVIALPNRPQIPAEQLKQAFVKPIVDTSNSMIQELDRIVEETNAELEQVQDDITDAIDEHNTNTEATHLDIRQEIADLDNDLQGQIDVIDDTLQDHESRIDELELFAGNLETNITEEIEDALENKADLVDGKVSREQLPSFVDDIIEGFYINGQFYSEGEASPEYLITPEIGKLYVEVDTNKMYRFLGGIYEEIPSPFELTKAKVEAVLTGDITSHNHTTEIGNHDTSETAHSDIRQKADEAKAIAEGKSRAIVFATEANLDGWLATPPTFTRPDGKTKADLKIGDNLYIEELDKPDYWWNGTNKVKLETEKVDLTDYAKSDDLAAVATTGSYNDLTNTPTIPTIPNISITNGSAESGKYISQIAVDATDKHELIVTKADLPQGFSGDYNDLTNRPTIPTIPNISITGGAAESGKYISQVAVDATDKHELIVTKADLPQGFSGNYNDLTNKPTIPTLSHDISTDIADTTKAVTPNAVGNYTYSRSAIDTMIGDIPTVRPTIELEVASLTTLTEAEKLAIKNTLYSLIVDDKIDGTKFDDIVLVTTNDLIRLHYSSIDYYVANPQITVIFETEDTKYTLHVPLIEYTYSTLTSTTTTIPTISTSITTDATSDIKTASPKAVKTYVDNAISTALDNLLGGEY